MRRATAKEFAVLCLAKQRNTAQRSAAQRSTGRYHTAQHSAAQLCSALLAHVSLIASASVHVFMRRMYVCRQQGYSREILAMMWSQTLIGPALTQCILELWMGRGMPAASSTQTTWALEQVGQPHHSMGTSPNPPTPPPHTRPPSPTRLPGFCCLRSCFQRNTMRRWSLLSVLSSLPPPPPLHGPLDQETSPNPVIKPFPPHHTNFDEP